MSIATKLDTVLTYDEAHPPVKLRDSLIKWSWKIKR